MAESVNMIMQWLLWMAIGFVCYAYARCSLMLWGLSLLRGRSVRKERINLYRTSIEF